MRRVLAFKIFWQQKDMCFLGSAPAIFPEICSGNWVAIEWHLSACCVAVLGRSIVGNHVLGDFIGLSQRVLALSLARIP